MTTKETYEYMRRGLKRVFQFQPEISYIITGDNLTSSAIKSEGRWWLLAYTKTGEDVYLRANYDLTEFSVLSASRTSIFLRESSHGKT